MDLLKESAFYSDHPNMLSGPRWSYNKRGKYEEALQALKQSDEKMTLYSTLHKRIKEIEQAFARKNQ